MTTEISVKVQTRIKLKEINVTADKMVRNDVIGTVKNFQKEALTSSAREGIQSLFLLVGCYQYRWRLWNAWQPFIRNKCQDDNLDFSNHLSAVLLLWLCTDGVGLCYWRSAGHDRRFFGRIWQCLEALSIIVKTGKTNAMKDFCDAFSFFIPEWKPDEQYKGRKSRQ